MLSQQDLTRNSAAYDALLNEVNILMCHKHKGQLSYHAVYEDNMNLYVVYEYWTGESLFRLLQQGFKPTPQQTASLVHQVAKVAKFLAAHDLYHGCLIPNNIIVLRQSQVPECIKIA